MNKGSSVLVFSTHGIGRCSAATVAFLMYHFKYSLEVSSSLLLRVMRTCIFLHRDCLNITYIRLLIHLVVFFLHWIQFALCECRMHGSTCKSASPTWGQIEGLCNSYPTGNFTQRDKDHRLSFWEKLGYGSGNISQAFGGQSPKAFGKPIYNIIFGINPGVIGTILMLSRIWDGLIDPIMGIITDNTRTKMGRRKPWIFIGALLTALAYPILWYLPAKWVDTTEIKSVEVIEHVQPSRIIINDKPKGNTFGDGDKRAEVGEVVEISLIYYNSNVGGVLPAFNSRISTTNEDIQILVSESEYSSTGSLRITTNTFDGSLEMKLKNLLPHPKLRTDDYTLHEPRTTNTVKYLVNCSNAVDGVKTIKQELLLKEGVQTAVINFHVRSASSDRYKILYVIFAGLLFYTAFTVFVVPYGALGLELTPDYKERTSVRAFVAFFGKCFQLLIPWVFRSPRWHSGPTISLRLEQCQWWLLG